MKWQATLQVDAVKGEFERTVRYPMRQNEEVVYHIRTFGGWWNEHNGKSRYQAIIYTRKPVHLPIPWHIYDITLWKEDKWESVGTQPLLSHYVQQVLHDCLSLIPNNLVRTL